MSEPEVVPDDARRARIGFDESIYCAGKSTAQLDGISPEPSARIGPCFSPGSAATRSRRSLRRIATRWTTIRCRAPRCSARGRSPDRRGSPS